jgi:hypothetical protein
MEVEGEWPSWGSRTNRSQGRSFVQAWFVGRHRDIGGSATKDGLALYPLQWMILESKALGLAFMFEAGYGGRTSVQNPLEILGIDDDQNTSWSCTTENKVTVEMRDIRRVHEPGSIYGDGYAIQLTREQGFLSHFKQPRRPFGAQGLRGYCSFGELIPTSHLTQKCFDA